MVLEGPGFYGSAMDRPFIGPAPALGDHTREIAVTLLGLTSERAEELIAAGVLEVTPPAVGGTAAAAF
jgi:crotonobetainyl-CoA:carnitine CoA-transferase CaiB-like acyl-CoA transferase